MTFVTTNANTRFAIPKISNTTKLQNCSKRAKEHREKFQFLSLDFLSIDSNLIVKLHSKLFAIYRSPVDIVLNILLYHVLASKESKRARVFIPKLPLERMAGNGCSLIHHGIIQYSVFIIVLFLRSDPTSKWMHNDISHLLVEMERFYSLENAIFPWKEGGQRGGGRRDTRHIQHGNTLTNAFDNVSGEKRGGGENDCV